MINEYVSYAGPQSEMLGSYVYLGFVPAQSISQGVTQGYRSNFVDKTFSNCDNNPNSYFTFFVNEDNNSPTRAVGSLSASGFDSHWDKNRRTVDSEEHLPDEYFLITEIHFGGCGVFSVSTGWGSPSGISIGLKHSE